MELFTNIPFLAAIGAIVFVQFIKVPLHLVIYRKWRWQLMLSSGGMPSSHSAAVTALIAALAWEHGFGSPYFAISAVFGAIVMYDASGIRRHAGQHASVLNKLILDWQMVLSHMKEANIQNQFQKKLLLKEMIGHEPSEVFAGAFVGIVIAVLLELLA